MSLLDLIEGSHKKKLRPSGGCHNCPRRRVGYVPPVLRETKVLFIGEAPGEQEVAAQEPFVGATGSVLRKYAEEVGLVDYSMTYLTHCAIPKGKSPRPREIECCLSQFVLDEIRGYPIVVLLGNAPLSALFPGAKGTHFRGNVAYHSDFPEQRFYSTYSPSYLLRRPDLESEFRQQMERLGRIAAGEPPLEWRVITSTSSEYWGALQKALASPMISFDIETNRLESWELDSRIRSLALTSDGRNVLYVSENDGKWIATMEELKKFMSNPDKHVVGMNIGFDLVWMEDELQFKVRCEGKHDVATIFYQAKQYKQPSLKELVSKELDGYRFLIDDPANEQDPDRLARYNAEDVVYTFQLFHKGMRLLKPKTRDLVMRVSGPSGYILRRISRNGFYLRGDYRKQKIEEYRERRRAVIEAWKNEDPAFEPSNHESGKGLMDYLFRIKGLPIVERTDKGEPSTDRTTLKRLIREYDATYLEHLLSLREIDKIESTYLTAYDKYLGYDSRIHSSYTNTLTDSGRASSRSPNLQNIPRSKEIRNLFGVPSGCVLLESDLSQIEFRIMVSLAQDENGIAAYLRGDDAHTTTARSFAENPTKEHRNWAKAINFALLFEGDWYNVQRTARDWYGLDWTERQARGFVDGFFRTYPGIRALHQKNHEDLVRNRGWFESVTGHTFFYHDWDHPDPARRDHAHRSAINAQAQGPAAQICFLIMIHADRLFHERKLPVKMVNSVHDSMLTEISDSKAVGEVIAAIEEAKDLAYEWVRSWFLVPLVMEHEVGESWGDLEAWNP